MLVYHVPGKHCIFLPSSLSPASLPPQVGKVGGVGNVVLHLLKLEHSNNVTQVTSSWLSRR